MNYRDYIQTLIYRVSDPLINAMIRLHIRPNHLTTMGFLLNVAAAALFCAAGFVPMASAIPLVGCGGLVLLLAGLSDILDGRLARKGNASTRFGALYDSTMDRYSEIVTLGGLFIFLFYQGYLVGGILTMLALAGSLMVSYVRARAEGLGIECKVGFMQRPERVVTTIAGTVLMWISGGCKAFDPVLILIVAMGLIALLANITALVRIYWCRKALTE